MLELVFSFKKEMSKTIMVLTQTSLEKVQSTLPNSRHRSSTEKLTCGVPVDFLKINHFAMVLTGKTARTNH